MERVIIKIAFTKTKVAFNGSTPVDQFAAFFSKISRKVGRPMITTTRKNLNFYLNGLYPNKKNKVIKNIEILDNPNDEIVVLEKYEYNGLLNRISNLETKVSDLIAIVKNQAELIEAQRITIEKQRLVIERQAAQIRYLRKTVKRYMHKFGSLRK